MIEQRLATYAGFGTRELFVEGAGPAIVLLHGFSHSADCWLPVLNRLKRAGLPAIAADLPGFGRADPLGDGPHLPQLDAFVADVVIRHARHAPVVLVGNSLGGLLALRAAQLSRGLPVSAIMTLGAAGTGWTRLVQVAAAGELALISALAALPSPACLRRVAVRGATRAVLYGQWTAADPVMINELSSPLQSRSGIRRLLAAAMPIFAEVSALEPFTDIECPTVVVQGDRDPVVSVQAARRLQDMLPHSRFVLLPRSGHCPQLDAPEQIAALAIELATADRDEHSHTAEAR